MASSTQFEGLIRLGTNGRILADACDCEGACACAEQPIEFVAVTTDLPSAASPNARAIDLKNVGGMSCC
ncbi:MAG: hypothetical protein OXC55_07625 [Chloroflexi bacterium]|nr:hypothetical protein [Chloroflexota bacterium]